MSRARSAEAHNAWVERYRFTRRDGSFATQAQVRSAVLNGILAATRRLPEARLGIDWRRRLADKLLADGSAWLAFRAGETCGSLRRAAEEAAWSAASWAR